LELPPEQLLPSLVPIPMFLDAARSLSLSLSLFLCLLAFFNPFRPVEPLKTTDIARAVALARFFMEDMRGMVVY